MLEIVEIRNSAEFQKRVVDGPEGHTFVVDFWAPWCGPCKTLGPVLESAVAPFGDKASLVKVNVDVNPDLATAFAVQSIPAVKIVRDGQLVAEFVGAQPETVVRKIVAEAIPSLADDNAVRAEALMAEGKDAQAEKLLRAALKEAPEHGHATLLLAALLLKRGDIETATALAESIAEGNPYHSKAQDLLARIGFVQVCRKCGGRSASAIRLAANENDVEARYQLACCMAADGDYDQALENFLECVRRDRNHNDGAARKAMITLFNSLGRDNPLVEEFRTRLSRMLFS